MGWIKDIQGVFPWLVSLPILPKVIIFAIIVGIAVVTLILIWTPPPEIAVATILKDCNRRAIFTRTHEHLNQNAVNAMFSSIAECRTSIQKNQFDIRSKKLMDIAADLVGTLESIERLRILCPSIVQVLMNG